MKQILIAIDQLANTVIGGWAYLSLTNTPAGLYTDDGLTFFSWTADVNAVRSPLANDTFNRIYYTGDNGFKVANRLGTRINGGAPSSSYLVKLTHNGTTDQSEPSARYKGHVCTVSPWKGV